MNTCIVPRPVYLLSDVAVEVHVLGDDLVRPLVGVGHVARQLRLGLDPDLVVEEGERVGRVVAELQRIRGDIELHDDGMSSLLSNKDRNSLYACFKIKGNDEVRRKRKKRLLISLISSRRRWRRRGLIGLITKT